MSKNNQKKKILFVSSPFKAEEKIFSIYKKICLLSSDLSELGYEVSTVTPTGYNFDNINITPIEVEGQSQSLIQNDYDEYRIQPNGVLQKIWKHVFKIKDRYDLIVNMSHDWLAFYMHNFFGERLIHVPNAGSINFVINQEIKEIIAENPRQIDFLSETQRSFFSDDDSLKILGNPIDFKNYDIGLKPSSDLIFAGRISPEKGLEDSAEIAYRAGKKLRVAGNIQNYEYWDNINKKYQDIIFYKGFLNSKELNKELSECSALLMTQKWEEAFGNITVEAMASGTPVIGYKKGANKELISHGENGFLIDEGDIDQAVMEISKIKNIDRNKCRKNAEKKFSKNIIAQRYSDWFEEIL